VGDSAKDILCASAAGCGKSILVRTGNGGAAIEELTRRGELPDHLADDLLTAVDWIWDHHPNLVSAPHEFHELHEPHEPHGPHGPPPTRFGSV
jgi:hypothetical protein